MQKQLWENSTPIFDEISHQCGYRGNIPQNKKAIYEKPTEDLILNSEKPKVFPLRSGRRQESPLSSLLFNILLEVLASAVRQEKKKMNPNWKEK